MLRLLMAGLLLLDPGGPRGEGFQDDRTAGVKLENSDIVITGNGARGGKADGYRVKRPCWYEPGPDAGQMAKTQEELRAQWFHQNPRGTEEQFQKFLKQFKDKVGEQGRWWKPAYNASDPKGYACWGGLNPFVWVPPGATPPAGITLEELYQIARAALTVPEPQIKLNPDAKSYVNLPTWVWLDGVGQTSRSVTASLPGIMSATVTAQLEDIKIDAGTKEAEVRENCGSAGKPYVRGGEFTCGVRYLRASVNEPRKVYVLTVTTVWPVEADADDDVVPFAYDPIEAGGTRDVPVGEVQSTVQGD
ncbi:hypothetical protein ACIBH1_02705 [Nonomuraea sp. NPDC050663]|uniref:hypothetical protein n=1 Tax=Nonomuraea sp. NPDC050663 TaxID=3364370 RepID=UPI0037BC0D4E